MFWSSGSGRVARVMSALLASTASLTIGCVDAAMEGTEDAPVSAQVAAPPDVQTPEASCGGGQQANFGLVGWATQSGGTTGGKGGRTVTVKTGAELVQTLKDKRKKPEPLTILVAGTITAANSGVDKIDLKEVDNISLIGAGAGATFDGIGIKINKARNIVVRNVRVQKVKSGDKDAISIEGPVDHVWIDHCELSAELDGVDKDYYDGLLDTKAESQYLTYSWNHLHDSWKASLVGSSEKDTFDRKLTYHHNWFEHINSRLPLFRGGTGHIFNNLYEKVQDTAANSRSGACLKVEANVFSDVQNPWVSAFTDALGNVEARCNVVGNGSRFTYDGKEKRAPGACSAKLPYDYAGVLTRPDQVAALVRANSGVGKLRDPTAF